MDEIEEAKLVYGLGKTLIAEFKDKKTLEDHVVWAIEDLEDALFDLKESVIGGDLAWLRYYSLECRSLIKVMQQLL